MTSKMYQLDRAAFQAWIESVCPTEYGKRWFTYVTDLVLVKHVFDDTDMMISTTMSSGYSLYMRPVHLLEIPEELQDSARAMFELQQETNKEI